MFINEQTWEYIRQHADDDVRTLALQGSRNPEVDLTVALQQIAGRQTARHKLPSWAAIDGIVYPPHLNMEQCSSEETARYKAEVAGEGATFIDLTGGFGVDFYWMSQRFQHRVYVEQSPELCALAEHNFRTLGFTADVCCRTAAAAVAALETLRTREEEAAVALASLGSAAPSAPPSLGCPAPSAPASLGCPAPSAPAVGAPFSAAARSVLCRCAAGPCVVYLDPARRNEHGGRTYGIADCTPNVLELLPALLAQASRVIVKLSPMLDWRKAVDDMNHVTPCVTEVHIVSVNNECKELLLVLEKEKAPTNNAPATPAATDNPPGGRNTPATPAATDNPPGGPRRSSCVLMFCINKGTNPSALSYPITDTPALPPAVTAPSSAAPSSALSPRAFAAAITAGGYLYEPNASIMKAGAFAEVTRRYPVAQIAQNSHLFVSADEIGDFPGRGFRIMAVSSLNKQELSTKLTDGSQPKAMPLKSANIAVRNFPMTAEQLRKKLKMKDGGNTYIFATTLADGSHKLFVCRKIG